MVLNPWDLKELTKGSKMWMLVIKYPPKSSKVESAVLETHRVENHWSKA